jgi:type IV pilus assembly protein PilA
MLSKISRMLRKQQGFTLVELMTVLIILGVILGIGVPKYLQVQAKAEWEADEATIRNFIKAAETYCASINAYNNGVTIKQLIDDKIIDGDTVLNRINGKDRTPVGTTDKSYKNEGKVKVSSYNTHTLVFNTLRGNVRNVGATVILMIGEPPYGTMPVYPLDNANDEGASL